MNQCLALISIIIIIKFLYQEHSYLLWKLLEHWSYTQTVKQSNNRPCCNNSAQETMKSKSKIRRNYISPFIIFLGNFIYNTFWEQLISIYVRSSSFNLVLEKVVPYVGNYYDNLCTCVQICDSYNGIMVGSGRTDVKEITNLETVLYYNYKEFNRSIFLHFSSWWTWMLIIIKDFHPHGCTWILACMKQDNYVDL
jgi:hypothetical protein